ncbi:hypothetical protein J3U68_06180 [Snodgrassella sp. B3882]|uniref:hypothetical protein n=1 Tax=Snodgrassella sp. B3882 TaxID=2818037 RepID=UPI00226A4262|nr:hypothetical protein [Snodgrassella sp. B3882]MCX8745000.1 hypothetical protein [Snodgrassella sp. B3882]
MKKIINNIVFLVSLLVLSSCFLNNSRELEKRNITHTRRTDTSELPIIDNYNCGHVETTGLGEYTLSFKKKGDMYGYYSFNMETILTHFKITLDNSRIRFKEKYQFIIGNYAGKDDLQFTLRKIDSQNLILEIIQFTRHSTTDKIYFSKNNENEYEIIKMEQLQPGNDNVQICPYSHLRIQHSKVNLISESIKNPDCYYKYRIK